MEFVINNVLWRVIFVPEFSDVLWTGSRYTFGVTDIEMRTIFISNAISGDFLHEVLEHEICHATIASYGYDMDIPTEECMCQVIEHHGEEVGGIANELYARVG